MNTSEDRSKRRVDGKPGTPVSDFPVTGYGSADRRLPRSGYAAAVALVVASVLGGCGGGSSGDNNDSTPVNDPGGKTESDPTVIAASLQAGDEPNTLKINWDFAGPADYFVLEGNPDGASGYTGVDINGDGQVDAGDRIPPGTRSVRIPLSVHLADFDNALYRLAARDRAGNELASSRELGLFGMPTADLIGYFRAAHTEGASDFLSTVALSADGETLALGAQSDRLEFGPGAVYVFARDDGGWSRQGYVQAPGDGWGDDFGYAVALSDNGNTLAIGARADGSGAIGVDGDRNTNRPGNLSGAVYLYGRSGGDWSRQAYVKASNTDEADFFGFSVALSGDGNTLGVGAPGEDGATTGVNGDDSDNSAGAYGAIAGGAGAVYVFSRLGGSWSQQAYVKASNTGLGDSFGASVALSGNGNTLAVGAVGESSSATGIDGNQSDNGAGGAGAVYVFGRSGNQWSQQAYVKASNSASGDRFGHTLALSAAGNTLAVGAPGEDSAARGVGGNQTDNSADGSGAVYVFTRTPGDWSQLAYIKASNTDRFDRFGQAIALSDSGHMLAIGANGEGSAATGIGGNQNLNNAGGAGAAYVFTRGGGAWSQKAYVKASNTASGDHFGNAIALSASGQRLAVAAHNSEPASGRFEDTIVDVAYLY
jgi:hypothetical protein